MKYINKDGYVELINRVRTPLHNVLQDLNRMDIEIPDKIIKQFDQVNSFLNEVSLNDGWEVTEDSDCWSSGGVHQSELKKPKNIIKAFNNSQGEK